MDWEQLARPPTDVLEKARRTRHALEAMWSFHNCTDARSEAGILAALDEKLDREVFKCSLAP